MKVVLFGTPKFAVPVFEALLNSQHKIIAVVSQPDRAKDRKGRLIFTPLKQAAEAAGIPVFQFESVKKEGVDTLKKMDADIFITAAFGQLLSQEILDIPRHGVINVHASLLPKYRGSSPIQHAILNGDTQTGITIMQTRLGLDSGEIIIQGKLDIGRDETFAELSDRLSLLGADLALKAINQIESGEATYAPQNEALATKCGKITSECGKINFSDSAQKIHNQVRALDSYAFFNDRHIKIIKTSLNTLDEFQDNAIALACATAEQKTLVTACDKGWSSADDARLNLFATAKAGEIIDSKRLIIRCGVGAIEILQLLPQGGKPMSGKDFLLGRKDSKKFFE